MTLVKELLPLVADAKAEVVVCPTYVCLPAVAEALKGSNVKLGAQNLHFEKSGAFTGEISADMLKEIGVEYVIIGHSERRQYFAETDETVNKKKSRRRLRQTSFRSSAWARACKSGNRASQEKS